MRFGSALAPGDDKGLWLTSYNPFIFLCEKWREISPFDLKNSREAEMGSKSGPKNGPKIGTSGIARGRKPGEEPILIERGVFITTATYFQEILFGAPSHGSCGLALKLVIWGRRSGLRRGFMN